MTRDDYRDRLEALLDQAPEGFKVVAVVGDMLSEEVSVICSCCAICAEGLLQAGYSSVEDQIHEAGIDGPVVWQ